jgi:hypothetical protein
MPGGSFSYDNNDRLGGDPSDANGNTISSAGIANTYDFENHMLSHWAVTIVYDGPFWTQAHIRPIAKDNVVILVLGRIRYGASGHEQSRQRIWSHEVFPSR